MSLTTEQPGRTFWEAVREFFDRFSEEERAFLAPLGAIRERLRLERTARRYLPLPGVAFGEGVPAFGSMTPSRMLVGNSMQQPRALEAAPARSRELLKLESLGVRIEPRALPEGAPLLICDLIISDREVERRMVPAERRRT
jgi:hypothetical protein